MTERTKYSVIIPVYNAESTIERCLNSLLVQIPAATEILVINDGSKDSSGETCKQYSEKYSVIQYFEKENGGVSSARNLGLDLARGDYILFVDSDDYVTTEYWQIIDKLLNENHPDMLQFGFRECGEMIRDRNTGDYFLDSDIIIAERIDAAIRDYLFSSLYARVFRREIIQKASLRFEPTLAIGEDQVFLFAYAMHVQSIISISKVLYNVMLENSESLSRKRRDYLVEQLLKVNHIMFDMLEKASLSVEVKEIYRGSVTWVYYRSAYSAFKELLKYDMKSKKRRKRIKEICGLYIANQVKPYDWKCKIIAFPIRHKMSYFIDFLISQAR